MKKLSFLFSTVASLLLIFAILVTSVQIVAFDYPFYEREYSKLNVTQYTLMEYDELMRVTEYLLDYVQGRHDKLDVRAVLAGKERTVFNERDQAHMVDVQALYLGVSKGRWYSFAIAAALYALAALTAKKGRRLRTLAKGYITGAVLYLLAFAVIGVWAVVDFTQFWTTFHELVFSNDLWLLDPRISVLINMYPETFFYDMVLRIVAIAAGALVMLTIISAAAISADKRRQKRAVNNGGTL